jgi:hypothetical protein
MRAVIDPPAVGHHGDRLTFSNLDPQCIQASGDPAAAEDETRQNTRPRTWPFVDNAINSLGLALWELAFQGQPEQPLWRYSIKQARIRHNRDFRSARPGDGSRESLGRTIGETRNLLIRTLPRRLKKNNIVTSFVPVVRYTITSPQPTKTDSRMLGFANP